jgi:hypothetical protein
MNLWQLDAHVSAAAARSHMVDLGLNPNDYYISQNAHGIMIQQWNGQNEPPHWMVRFKAIVDGYGGYCSVV